MFQQIVMMNNDILGIILSFMDEISYCKMLRVNKIFYTFILTNKNVKSIVKMLKNKTIDDICADKYNLFSEAVHKNNLLCAKWICLNIIKNTLDIPNKQNNICCNFNRVLITSFMRAIMASPENNNIELLDWMWQNFYWIIYDPENNILSSEYMISAAYYNNNTSLMKWMFENLHITNIFDIAEEYDIISKYFDIACRLNNLEMAATLHKYLPDNHRYQDTFSVVCDHGSYDILEWLCNINKIPYYIPLYDCMQIYNYNRANVVDYIFSDKVCIDLWYDNGKLARDEIKLALLKGNLRLVKCIVSKIKIREHFDLVKFSEIYAGCSHEVQKILDGS